MAWTKQAWADVIGTDSSRQTVAASGSQSGTIDCNGTNKLITIAVRVAIDFGGSAADSITVELFPLNADDTNEQDTLPAFPADIPQVTSTEQIVTYQVNCSAWDSVVVRLTNNDGSNSVTSWVSFMGGYA